jgi:heat shock protein HslJ
MYRKNVWFLAGVLFLICGCGLINSQDPVDGTQWQLNTLAGEGPVSGSSITLDFADQRLSGSAGCNGYGASYEIQGDGLKVGAIAMTQMACQDESIMRQEQKFADLLGKAALIKESKESLELFDENGNNLMTFSPRER